jgi:diaminopimelate decarboxylase
VSRIPRGLLPDHSSVGPGGQLLIAGVDIAELAAEHGTPLFVYDEDQIRARCREAVKVFGDGNVVYATKAFLCRAIARLVHEEGLLLDVATGGELHVALSAGVPAERLVVHGNNKSMEELRTALTAGVGLVVVDSFDELDRLDMAADLRLESRLGCQAVVTGDVTVEIPAWNRNYISEGGGSMNLGDAIPVAKK